MIGKTQITKIPSGSQIRPALNWVLIEPSADIIEQVRMTKGGIAINTIFEPEQNAIITGKIIAVPQALKYVSYLTDIARLHSAGTRKPEARLEYDVEMEAQVGDEAYFSYLAISNALNENDGIIIEHDGKYFVFVRYDRLICGFRDGKLIPYNGNIFFEPIKNDEPTEVKGLHNPFIEPFKKNQGVVVASGSKIREDYFDVMAWYSKVGKSAEYMKYVDSGGYQVGDHIFYDSAISLENELLKTRDLNLKYCRETFIAGKFARSCNAIFIPNTNRILVRTAEKYTHYSNGIEIPESHRKPQFFGQCVAAGQQAQRYTGAVKGKYVKFRHGMAKEISKDMWVMKMTGIDGVYDNDLQFDGKIISLPIPIVS